MELSRIGALVGRYGQSLTLQRTGAADLAVKGTVRGARPGEMVAGLAQFDRVAIVANDEIAAAAWPGPPRKDDRLVIAGVTTAVLAVETRRVGDAVALHLIAVQG